MFEYVCFFIVLSVIVSWAWPDPKIKQRADDQRHREEQCVADQRHREMLAAIATAARQSAAPVAPITPEHSPAYRSHVIALGRIRDRENGLSRHPLLDGPPTSVTGAQTRPD
jgi:hypothetical protein